MCAIKYLTLLDNSNNRCNWAPIHERLNLHENIKWNEWSEEIIELGKTKTSTALTIYDNGDVIVLRNTPGDPLDDEWNTFHHRLGIPISNEQSVVEVMDPIVWQAGARIVRVTKNDKAHTKKLEKNTLLNHHIEAQLRYLEHKTLLDLP